MRRKDHVAARRGTQATPECTQREAFDPFEVCATRRFPLSAALRAHHGRGQCEPDGVSALCPFRRLRYRVAVIPLTDLGIQHRELAGQIEAAIAAVFASQQFILGPAVEAFERAAGEWLGAADAVGVSSGTDALLLALLAEGIGPGDEVITSALSFVASAEVIARVGATPVFVDIQQGTWCLDPQAVADAVTERTRAILAVHLFGQPADLGELRSISSKHGLVLIEDAAQAFGAKWNEHFVGTVGDYGAFSFFPAKILGGAGDGGMVLARADRADKVRALRQHGSCDKREFKFIGGNFRLDALQAAILSVKLPHVESWVERRRRAAEIYREQWRDRAVDSALLALPHERPGSRHAFNQFVVATDRRDGLLHHLGQQGIASAVHYSIPLHLQPCFSGLGYRAGQLPVAERAARRLLALPMFPELTESQIHHIVSRAADYLEEM